MTSPVEEKVGGRRDDIIFTNVTHLTIVHAAPTCFFLNLFNYVSYQIALSNKIPIRFLFLDLPTMSSWLLSEEAAGQRAKAV